MEMCCTVAACAVPDSLLRCSALFVHGMKGGCVAQKGRLRKSDFRLRVGRKDQ